ncbi:hypothetical protein QIS99_19190 [Streptomyces sp. B-S-A8]|uniref:PE domain-containing protein n=1 Tax=Streptomyces solicavernae TaxID=3043614 RepID=A0ABT6RV79_9ACTN|nr:hypothetical protein [Streptomyces sp. B-S-A8]MDI3388312.1 hypothetical protein [Streptomyces sp. B-S-A8]
MGDSTGMRVDLSALDEVVSRLRTLVDDMEEAGKTSKYRTDIPQSAFGQAGTFLEAGDLFNAHETAKSDLNRAITDLQDLIEKFGTSTSKVRGKYTEQEYATKEQMGGGSGKWE